MQVTSAPLVSLNNRPVSSYSCSHAGEEVSCNTKHIQYLVINWTKSLKFLVWSSALREHQGNSLIYSCFVLNFMDAVIIVVGTIFPHISYKMCFPHQDSRKQKYSLEYHTEVGKVSKIILTPVACFGI